MTVRNSTGSKLTNPLPLNGYGKPYCFKVFPILKYEEADIKLEIVSSNLTRA